MKICKKTQINAKKKKKNAIFMLIFMIFGKKSNIIFEDSSIIVVNKPFGMLSCQDKKKIDKDLYTIMFQWRKC